MSRNGRDLEGGKRTAAQRKLDVVKVCQLIERGWTFDRIAETLELPRSTVMRDYKHALALFAKRANVASLEQARARAIAQYQRMQNEADDAWELSKRPAVKKVVEETPVRTCPVCDGAGSVKSKQGESKRCSLCKGACEVGGVERIIKTVQGRLPDPRFLQVAGNALKEEMELRGVVTGAEAGGKGRSGDQDRQIPWVEVIRKAKVESQLDPVEAEIEAVNGVPVVEQRQEIEERAGGEGTTAVG